MTREEAARIIKLERDGLKESEKNELLKLKIDPCLYTAFDVAIQALEQDPCEDAISRQAVFDEAFEVDTKEYGRIDVVGVDAIDALPPVRQQELKYCDRNICLKNEYNGIGCDECEVTKSQVPKTGHCRDCSKTKNGQKARNNMWKYPSYEVIKSELPCVMCENWNERIHECSLHYGYTGDSECNKRKAERGECQ